MCSSRYVSISVISNRHLRTYNSPHADKGAVIRNEDRRLHNDMLYTVDGAYPRSLSRPSDCDYKHRMGWKAVCTSLPTSLHAHHPQPISQDIGRAFLYPSTTPHNTTKIPPGRHHGDPRLLLPNDRRWLRGHHQGDRTAWRTHAIIDGPAFAYHVLRIAENRANSHGLAGTWIGSAASYADCGLAAVQWLGELEDFGFVV